MIDLTPLDFDDILIVPAPYTKITSRYKEIYLPDKLPIFTAPMDTVVNLDNVNTYLKNGIGVALPRTIKYNDYLKSLNDTQPNNEIFLSFGFSDLDGYHTDNFEAFAKNTNIIIDVANGHMQKIVDYSKEIKRLRPDITIMVGNIGNPETYYWYAINNCVDYIRVGIGNGCGCLTTKQSGIGYPMASLIYTTLEFKKEFIKDNPNKKAPAIVADGGMKNYSDIIKAFALGADYVMIGSIFNKAFESSGNMYLWNVRVKNEKYARFLFNMGLPIVKYFRGMSTKEAQKAMGKTNIKTSEGIVRYEKVEYYLQGWLENFEHYLRNAMSYANANTLDDFIGNVEICKITKNAYDRFNK